MTIWHWYHIFVLINLIPRTHRHFWWWQPIVVLSLWGLDLPSTLAQTIGIWISYPIYYHATFEMVMLSNHKQFVMFKLYPFHFIHLHQAKWKRIILKPLSETYHDTMCTKTIAQHIIRKYACEFLTLLNCRLKIGYISKPIRRRPEFGSILFS